ncbi:MAG: rod shape-determining protein MreC, partial [Acidimicrobiia bacterium]
MRERRHQDRATPMLVVLVVLSFLLMTFDIRADGGGVAGTLREGTQSVFAPVQDFATSLISPVVDFIDGLANLAGLRDENETLRRRIAELEARVDEIGTLEAEVETLRRVTGLTLPDESIPTKAARVIARGDSFDSSFTIDKGTDDGLVAGNPVVDENGALVGEISVVTRDAATVIPIIRPTGAVTVESQTGETGFVRGQGSAILIFEVPEATEPVLAGYLLLTAGSEKFPPGLPVAKVADSDSPEAAKIRTEAIPVADFNRLKLVVVLQWTFSAQDQQEEQPVTDETPPADSESETSA